ncbi:acyl-CoA dehydrogenase family protein [Nocardioides aequoreus]|uniref:acyl-CoA dehydrogenase family protein n=1 Tax=Nocardioides aequoreus TaxID=397278 RepID=UPI0004C3BFA4|nr:acyl-CoA dehydrogenase family protein [Nocardioides aequoreus]
MQLALSKDDTDFREEMRAFFTEKVASEIRDAVRAGHHLTKAQIVEAQQTLNAAGLAVPSWPAAWGGRDWTPLQRHIWQQEMELACVPPPLAFNTGMIGPVIAHFGSEEMKQRFLPPTANLDIWWAQGFSEPDAGSDLASLKTRAVRDGDDWVIDGQKTWTTLGQHADWIFVLCRTDPDAPKKQQGISMILVPIETEGVTVRPIKLIDGGKEVNEVWFESVRVPGDLLVGEENQGWTMAKFLLGNERVGVAPVGQTKRRLATLKEHAREVGLLDDAVLASRIAELENDLLALELTALRVVASSSEGKPHPASSVLKLQGTVLQQAVTELLVDVAGPLALASGAGEDSEVPDWARVSAPLYLNYRKASIYGGSNEIQRQIIAGSILGL